MIRALSALLQQYHDYLLLIDSLIIGCAVFWQYYLIVERDKYLRGSAGYFLPRFMAVMVPYVVPKRAVLPYLFGICIIVGTIAYTYLEYGHQWNFMHLLFANIVLAVWFFLIIVAKSWFGPLMLAISIVSVLHQLSHGSQDLTWMPDFIQDMIEPIFDHLPKVVYTAYTIISLIYISLSSFVDSIDNHY